MASRPSADLTDSRSVSIRLDKTALNSNEYNFQIVLTTYVGKDTGHEDIIPIKILYTYLWWIVAFIDFFKFNWVCTSLHMDSIGN